MGRLRGRRVHAVGPFQGSVSVVLGAYNEEAFIVRRPSELASLLAASGRAGEIVIVPRAPSCCSIPQLGSPFGSG